METQERQEKERVAFRDAKEVSDPIAKTLKPRSVVLVGSVAKRGVGADLDQTFPQRESFLEQVYKEGQVLYMEKAVEDRLRKAQEELDTSEYLVAGGFYKGTCYHAQQSVEKAIKARFLSKGWELEKTHSIERLLAIAGDL